MLGTMRRRNVVVALLSMAASACPAPSQSPAGAAVEPSEAAASPSGTEAAAQPWEEPAGEPAPAAPERPIVVAHNRVRAEHCAPDLVWSPALEAEATAWARQLAADGCAFAHSSTAYGENLAAGTTGALDADAVVAMWADEAALYDWKRPGFSMKTGHFTQVVWKDTQAIGCATVTCRGLDLWVCNYEPAGNVEGAFPANVAPRGCR
jgi:uncharacterized protein YkwD